MFYVPAAQPLRGRVTSRVKAIIIYPMNALATDQASRFAKTIASDPQLHEQGDHRPVCRRQRNRTQQKNVGRRSLPASTRCAKARRDILLTNYKMLDYLLMRPGDQPLWRYDQPGSLRYLVVDRLHTFDGAQGSDLALSGATSEASHRCG